MAVAIDKGKKSKEMDAIFHPLVKEQVRGSKVKPRCKKAEL